MPVRTTKAVAIAVLVCAHVRLPPRIAAEPIGPLVPPRARDLVALLPLPLRVVGDVPRRDTANSVEWSYRVTLTHHVKPNLLLT